MNKQYDHVTKQIFFLVLIIAIVWLLILTYSKIDQFNREKIDDQCTNVYMSEFQTYLHDSPLDETELFDFYKECSGLFLGGYGDIYFDNGKQSRKIKITDYAIIQHYIYNHENIDEKTSKIDIEEAILLLESEEDELYKKLHNDQNYGEIENVSSIQGMIDGIFLRGGNLDLDGLEYEIPSHDSVLGKNPIFGELSECIYQSRMENGDVKEYTRIKLYSRSLSKEAKAIHEQVWGSDEEEKDTAAVIKRGIITSYYSLEREIHNNADTFRVRVTQVFHPLEEVLKSNKLFYIIYVVIVGSILFFICYARGLYHYDENSKELVSSSLVRSCSYELKEPFHSLKDSVEKWIETSEESRMEYSDEIIAEVDRMDDMIKNILIYKDLNLKKIEPKYETIDLYLLTQRIYKQLETYLIGKSIKTTIRANNPEKCEVRADLEMLKIIIKNLIMIATEYAKEYMDISIETIDGEIVTLSINSKGVEISLDDAKNMWLNESRSSIIEDEVYDSSGVSMLGAVIMMQAQGIQYGSQPIEHGSRFWIKVKGTEE